MKKINPAKFNRISYLLSALLLLGVAPVHGSQSPTTFVEQVFTDFVAQLSNLDGQPSTSQVEGLFEQTLSPHIDYPGLARWTLRDHWKNSNNVQRQAFLGALKKHVIKTYANALAFDKSMRLSLDEKVSPGKRLTQVSGQLETGGRNPMNVLFRLVDIDNGWQIFDVGIHGISIAKTLRADISAVATRGGIDAATTALQSGNLRLLSQR